VRSIFGRIVFAVPVLRDEFNMPVSVWRDDAVCPRVIFRTFAGEMMSRLCKSARFFWVLLQ
jgi:hypothetical protein